MRVSLCLAAIAALSSAGLFAQTTNNRNPFQVWDNTTEFTSRYQIGGEAGTLSMGFTYGQTGGLNELTRTRYVMQDQNAATREPWDVGTCELNAAGVPDYAKLNAYATNMLNPASTGIRAWLWTHNPLTANPHKLNLKQCDQWHHAWNLQQKANWTTDGISVHMSMGAPWNGTLLCSNGGHREIARAEGNPAQPLLEKLAFSTVGTNKTPRAGGERTWRVQMDFNEPTLQGASDNTVYNTGCPNPNKGYAALDPDIDNNGKHNPARFDDYEWTVTAGAKYAGGIAVMLHSSSAAVGRGAASPLGQVRIEILDPLFAIMGPVATQALTSTGSGTSKLTLGKGPNGLRTIVGTFANWHTQALVVKAGEKPLLSNLWSMRPKLLPAGFTKATTVSGTPANINKTAAQRTMLIRNDGPGELTVEQYRGSTKLPGSFLICERTAVRLNLSIAATIVRVTTSKTANVEFIHAFNK